MTPAILLHLLGVALILQYANATNSEFPMDPCAAEPCSHLKSVWMKTHVDGRTSAMCLTVTDMEGVVDFFCDCTIKQDHRRLPRKHGKTCDLEIKGKNKDCPSYASQSACVAGGCGWLNDDTYMYYQDHSDYGHAPSMCIDCEDVPFEGSWYDGCHFSRTAWTGKSNRRDGQWISDSFVAEPDNPCDPNPCGEGATVEINMSDNRIYDKYSGDFYWHDKDTNQAHPMCIVVGEPGAYTHKCICHKGFYGTDCKQRILGTRTDCVAITDKTACLAAECAYTTMIYPDYWDYYGDYYDSYGQCQDCLDISSPGSCEGKADFLKFEGCHWVMRHIHGGWCQSQARKPGDGIAYSFTGAGDSPSDPCGESPCANNGTCAADDSELGYTCTCAAGYEGATCETETDECTPNPCQNGGICTDGANSYTCDCADGFEGDDCETETDECTPNPCQNGGVCTDGANSYSCACADGFEGDDCETETDECTPNPCQNGGVCTDGANSYSCACADGFEGDDCETETDECTPNPCQNGGVCTDGANSYSCACADGFEGDDCETETNECTPNPCQNGGVCTGGANSYSCACADGFEGDDCETDAVPSCSGSNVANCAVCKPDKPDKCIECETGYALKKGKKKCVSTSEETCELSDTTVANCAVCTPGITKKCKQCEEGYKRKRRGMKCKLIPTCENTVMKVANCVLCKPGKPKKCKRCEEGYQLNKKKTECTDKDT